MRTGCALGLAACLALPGCGVTKQMLAAPDDLADYRAFRIASGEGKRLSRAQTYLRRHPRGAWADEVRASFDEEEDAWFEGAKTSRARARDYVIDLPHGPHADAARALLMLFDTSEPDLGMLELLADARRTSASLDMESAQRARVSEVVLEEVAALVDPAAVGASLDAPPAALGRVLRGSAPRTWGPDGPAGVRDDDLRFVVRSPNEVQGRDVQVALRVAVARHRFAGGTIAGDDLFTRWIESAEQHVYDATEPSDRAEVAAKVAEVLGGALEARLPAARCATRLSAREVFARSCDGWRVSARMGEIVGDADVITVTVRPPSGR
jgi:hypothetical protein